MFGVTYFLLRVAMFLAWITNLIDAIDREYWVLLLTSVILFPVGIVRGIGIWFGVW